MYILVRERKFSLCFPHFIFSCCHKQHSSTKKQNTENPRKKKPSYLSINMSLEILITFHSLVTHFFPSSIHSHPLPFLSLSLLSRKPKITLSLVFTYTKEKEKQQPRGEDKYTQGFRNGGNIYHYQIFSNIFSLLHF